MIALAKLAIPPAIFALSFAGCGKQPNTSTTTPGLDKNGNVIITYWRPETYNDPFPQALTDFQSENAGIVIKYQTFPEDVYEQRVVEALANGTGPDVWELSGDEIEQHWQKLYAAPDSIANASGIAKKYVPQVASEIVRNNQVMGLVSHMEPLRIIENSRIFDDAGVDTELPQNWSGVVNAARQLTKFDDKGKMTQSGLAIGSGEEVFDSADIMSLIFMQYRTDMVKKSLDEATFNLFQRTDSGISYVGRNALKFYTDFAKPSSANYTWDPTLGGSVQAFTQGKVAMTIGYERLVPFFKKKNPSLQISTAAVPQIWLLDYPTRKATQPQMTRPIDFAKSRVQVVSKVSVHPVSGWKFLSLFIATANLSTGQHTGAFLATEEPDWFDDRPEPQFAATWFKGPAPRQTDMVLRVMADDVVKRNQPIETAINKAAEQVTALLQQVEK